jgi:hypothetical protein
MEGGMIFTVFNELVDSKTMKFGKINTFTGRFTTVNQNLEEISIKKKISTFDENGNFYWAPGNDEVLVFNTFDNKKNILKYPNHQFHSLLTQPVTKSVYGVFSVDSSFGVYQLIRGVDENMNWTVNTNLVKLDPNPTTISVINSVNHEFLTIYQNQEIQNLKVFQLDSEVNVAPYSFNLQNYTISSMGCDYKTNRILGIGTRDGRIQVFHLNYNQLNLKIETVYKFDFIEKEIIKFSNFHFYNDNFYISVISNFRMVMIDIRRMSYIFELNHIPSLEFHAFELNPKIKF